MKCKTIFLFKLLLTMIKCILPAQAVQGPHTLRTGTKSHVSFYLLHIRVLGRSEAEHWDDRGKFRQTFRCLSLSFLWDLMWFISISCIQPQAPQYMLCSQIPKDAEVVWREPGGSFLSLLRETLRKWKSPRLLVGQKFGTDLQYWQQITHTLQGPPAPSGSRLSSAWDVVL